MPKANEQRKRRCHNICVLGMAIIRKIEISNFRSLASFVWLPSDGINCLIGPGDSGKSSVLDAIDYCLGARRNLQPSDSDFHGLDVERPIRIDVTLGKLSDSLKNIDAYGNYIRSFDPTTGDVVDEPRSGFETVLTLRLTVENDLEPKWMLVSERTADLGTSRSLNWADRVRVAPTRIGTFGATHLSWRRGSILNRMSDERANATGALIKAGREARLSFGEQAKSQLEKTLKSVLDTATYLGIDVGKEVKALLDVDSVSSAAGTISLHDEQGIPLTGLGLGSSRLLIAGLQRMAADNASMILIDELEYGLEPHRIIRLIDALGAKVVPPPLQVFVTTHSPAAIRELSGAQLYILRTSTGIHTASNVGTDEEIQGAIRLHPEALLAASVLVCEGASEIGLLRGLDQHFIAQNKQALAARGLALVDGNGKNTYRRACAFQAMGYRTAVLCDSDLILRESERQTFENEKLNFEKLGGTVFTWQDGDALEEALFLCLSDNAVMSLVEYAIELRGQDFVDANIQSACSGQITLASIRSEASSGDVSFESCKILAKAAKSGKGWFKSITAMEFVAREIVGADLEHATDEITGVIEKLFEWTSNGRR